MSEYDLAYYGGQKPASPEEGAEQMARWHAWIEGLGAAMDNPGTPLGKSRTVSASGVEDGGGANPLVGFSVIQADSLDAAVEIAKSCPFVDMGTIEVAEVLAMNS